MRSPSASPRSSRGSTPTNRARLTDRPGAAADPSIGALCSDLADPHQLPHVQQRPRQPGGPDARDQLFDRIEAGFQPHFARGAPLSEARSGAAPRVPADIRPDDAAQGGPQARKGRRSKRAVLPRLGLRLHPEVCRSRGVRARRRRADGWSRRERLYACRFATFDEFARQLRLSFENRLAWGQPTLFQGGYTVLELARRALVFLDATLEEEAQSVEWARRQDAAGGSRAPTARGGRRPREGGAVRKTSGGASGRRDADPPARATGAERGRPRLFRPSRFGPRPDRGERGRGEAAGRSTASSGARRRCRR